MRSVVLLALFLAGCSSLPSIFTQENVEMPQMIQWVHFPLEPDAASKWLEEAKRRFRDPVIFSCHGGVGQYTRVVRAGSEYRIETVETWFVYPQGDGRVPMPLEWVAWTLHNLYPDRDIVFVVCNTDGSRFECHVPRVWFAKNSIWASPDRAAGIFHEKYRGKNTVGNIWEFQMGDGGVIVEDLLDNFLAPATPTTSPVQHEK